MIHLAAHYDIHLITHIKLDGIPSEISVSLQSLVSGDLYEFYIFELYLEQISVEEDHVDTRLRFHRTLATPLLPRSIFSENSKSNDDTLDKLTRPQSKHLSLSGTVLEEGMFTVYLGDIPADVELAALHLNGEEFAVPCTNTSSHSITNVVHPNNTHGYTLKVPCDEPVVIQQVKGLFEFHPVVSSDVTLCIYTWRLHPA